MKEILFYLLVFTLILQASSLTKKQEKMMRKAFDLLDVKKRGSFPVGIIIKPIEFIKGKKAVDIDANGNGEIEINEFLNLASLLKIDNNDAEMEKKICAESKLVSRAIVKKFLCSAKLVDWDADDIDTLLDNFDRDKSGMFECEELLKVLNED